MSILYKYKYRIHFKVLRRLVVEIRGNTVSTVRTMKTNTFCWPPPPPLPRRRKNLPRVKRLCTKRSYISPIYFPCLPFKLHAYPEFNCLFCQIPEPGPSCIPLPPSSPCFEYINLVIMSKQQDKVIVGWQGGPGPLGVNNLCPAFTPSWNVYGQSF